MPLLLILFVAAVVEVVALVVVGNALGVLPTIGLLVLAAVVGGLLLRREGTRALAAFTEAVRLRRPPHRELADGVLLVTAGVLIVLPGFLSDVLSLLLLLPPTRALVRGRIVRAAERRGSLGGPAFGAAAFGGGLGGPGFGPVRYGPDVVDGEVVSDVPDPGPAREHPVIDQRDEPPARG